MDVASIRAEVKDGVRPLWITTHEQTEAFKDGLLLADLLYAFEQGDVIETYQNEARLLLYSQSQDRKLPVHVIIEDAAREVVIVTAYVPDPRQWEGFTRRKGRR